MQRREGEEILARQVNLQPAQTDLLAQRLREGVVDLDILHAQVGRVLLVTGVGNFEQFGPRIGTVRLVGSHARPISRIPVVLLLAVHVVRIVVNAQHPHERTGVLAPEITRIGRGVPVALHHALQEDRQSDAVPVGRQIDAEHVVRIDVADDRQVAVIVGGESTGIDVAVMIEIGDLDLPGARHLVRRLREVVRGRGVDVGLIAEQPGYGIPPHLAQLHAFVEVRGRTAVLDIAFERTERTGGILVLGHHRTVVPHHRLDAVIERLAAQLERVAPCERQLPARSAQFGVVALGRRGAVDRRQRNAGRVHVGGVAAVVVAAERETVVQEIEVESQVVGRRLLPRQRHGHRTAHRRIGGQPSAEHDVRSGSHGHLRRVGVGIDVAVAHRTGRKADLEVVEPLLRPFHPRLLRHAPRHRC